MTNENKEVKQKKAKNVIPGTNVSKVGVIVTSVILAVLIAIPAFFVVVFSAQPYELKDGKLDVYKLTSSIYTKMMLPQCLIQFTMTIRESTFMSR